MGQLRFVYSARLTTVCALVFPLLIVLGFWQLQRADEKASLEARWQIAQAQPAVDYREILDQTSPLRRVFAQGHFDTQRYWLLENKVYQGALGYQVIAPFKTSAGDWLAVNAGWVPANAYRNINPEVVLPTAQIRVTGNLRKPSDSAFIGEQQASDTWPQRLLEIDTEFMSRVYAVSGVTLLPFELQLDRDSPGAFSAVWQPINMPPARHRAYAVQWFAMATALLVLWLISSVRRVPEQSRNSEQSPNSEQSLNNGEAYDQRHRD